MDLMFSYSSVFKCVCVCVYDNLFLNLFVCMCVNAGSLYVYLPFCEYLPYVLVPFFLDAHT